MASCQVVRLGFTEEASSNTCVSVEHVVTNQNDGFGWCPSMMFFLKCFVDLISMKEMFDHVVRSTRISSEGYRTSLLLYDVLQVPLQKIQLSRTTPKATVCTVFY